MTARTRSRKTAAQPAPSSNEAAGALVLCGQRDFKRKWILEAVKAWPPERHGRRWVQRFVQVTVGDNVACFYEITGYATHSENVAFEHLFFAVDKFVQYLDTASAPADFISVVDVGSGQEPEVFDSTGAPRPATALRSFGCTVEDLRKARASLAVAGEEIWRLR